MNGHRGLVPSNFLQALPEEPPAERPPAPPAPEPKKESQVEETHTVRLLAKPQTRQQAFSLTNVFSVPSPLLSLTVCCHLYFAPSVACMAFFRRSTNELCTLRRDRKCSERHLCFPFSRSPLPLHVLVPPLRCSFNHSPRRQDQQGEESVNCRSTAFSSVCVRPPQCSVKPGL